MCCGSAGVAWVANACGERLGGIIGAPRATVAPRHNFERPDADFGVQLAYKQTHPTQGVRSSESGAAGYSAPRRVVLQKRAVRTTTLASLLTAPTNPAPLAQRYSVVLQGSADAGIARVGASYCRQNGARATRVAPLWAARSPSLPLPAMLHAACGVS